MYGSEGALICRLVEENGICETLRAAKPDAVEFRELEVPARFYPPGGSARESWRTLFYANLDQQLHWRILSGGAANEGDFGDGAWVQEVINAVEHSFRERRWVAPACRCDAAGAPMTALDAFFDSYYRVRPVNATFTGVHGYDDRLPEFDPDGLDRAADEMRAVRTSLVAERDAVLKSRNDLVAAMRLDTPARDRELAISFLDVQLAENESAHFQRGNPSLALGEAVFGAISLITRPFAPPSERAAPLAARLEAVPRFLAGAQQSIRQSIPEMWRLKCLRECEGADILFRDGIARWAASTSIASSDVERLDRAAKNARRGLETFRSWLARGDARAVSPAGRMDCGPELFGLLLGRGHWCPRPPSDLASAARGIAR